MMPSIPGACRKSYGYHTAGTPQIRQFEVLGCLPISEMVKSHCPEVRTPGPNSLNRRVMAAALWVPAHRGKYRL